MRLVRIVLPAMVIVLAAAGCGSQGNVFSLEVGDCFTEPEEGLIADVELIDCAEPHANEVFAVWSVNGDSLPEPAVFNEGCIERFEEVIGSPYDESAIYSFPIYPSSESFESGDRDVVCYGVELDDEGEAVLRTGTLLGSGA